MTRVLALLLLLSSLPIWPFLYLIIKLDSKGSFIFKQKRMGKDKRAFTLYKIRTMVDNAQKLKQKYLKLNEADGPVFKIRNDPRYTKVGRFLSHTALDELPQLINVLKGEMAFVGPRPLPVDEALKVPKRFEERFSVLPGMTSLWILKGAHSLSFDEWMKLDIDYVEKKSLWQDLGILTATIVLVARLIVLSTGSSKRR